MLAGKRAYFCFSAEAKGSFAHLGYPDYFPRVRADHRQEPLVRFWSLLTSLICSEKIRLIRYFRQSRLHGRLGSMVAQLWRAGYVISHVIRPRHRLQQSGRVVRLLSQTPQARMNQDVETFESGAGRAGGASPTACSATSRRAEDMVRRPGALAGAGMKRWTPPRNGLVTTFTRLCFNDLDSRSPAL